MDGHKPVIAAEIACVQSKDVVDSVDVHRGGKAGIVNLNSRDPKLANQLPPLPINILAIREKVHACFDCLDLAFGVAPR